MSKQPATPEPAEPPTDGWTASQVIQWLATKGRPIALSTWLTYVKRNQAPQHVRKYGKTRVWSPADVEAWHARFVGPGRPRKSTRTQR